MFTKREINEYLFYEFGCDGDAGTIADDWPYELTEAGSFTVRENLVNVFTFKDTGEEFYVIIGRALDFEPVAEMDLGDLRREYLGSEWISRRNRLNLDTVLLDKGVPSTSERRSEIEHLAIRQSVAKPFTILEGLLLRDRGDYLGLVQTVGENIAHVVGSKINVRKVPFAEASPWRRLSVAIGMLIEQGKLSYD